MPSIDSTSCAMISGRSGLPKFRLLVVATGSAPTVDRLRQHSATISFVPSRGIEIAVAAVAVERHGDRRPGLLDAHDRRVGARPGERVRADHVVVLLARSSASSRDRPRRAASPDRASRSALAGTPAPPSAPCGSGLRVRPVVERRFVGELRGLGISATTSP